MFTNHFTQHRLKMKRVFLTIAAVIAAFIILLSILFSDSLLGFITLLLSCLLLAHSFYSLLISCLNWYRTISICGMPPLRTCKTVLDLNSVAPLRQGIKGPIFSKSLTFIYFILSIALMLLWLHFSSLLFFSFSVFFLVWSITELLNHSRPPLILLLGSSSRDTLVLQTSLEEITRGLGVVSLLQRDESDPAGVVLPHESNILRMNIGNRKVWLQVIRVLVCFVPVIVVDARHVSKNVIIELQMLLYNPYPQRIIVIENRECIEEFLDAGKVVNTYTSLPVLGLLDLLRNKTKSRDCLTRWMTSEE